MGGGWLEFIAIRRLYMGLCGQGSRGRGISAIGGWQWRRGSRAVFTGGRLFAGTTERGMGPRPPSSRGQDLDARTTRRRAAGVVVVGMTCGQGGWVPAPVFTGGRLFAGTTEGGGGVPAPVFGGRDLRGNNGVVHWNNGWVGGTGGSRTAPTGENVVGHGVHPPSPVFTRAGSSREQRGEGQRDSSAPLGMTCGRWGKRMGMGSRPRFHGGRLFAGTMEGKGNEIPRLRSE